MADFDQAGARLVAIGNGTPTMAKDFVDRFGIGFDVFTDPDRETYARAGMKRKLGLGLSTMKGALRALKEGHVQGRTQGDPFQQGGVVVVKPDGSTPFHHVDDQAGEDVDLDAILAAARP